MHESSATVIGWVEIQPAESDRHQVTIVGRALALEPISGRYALFVSRSGKGGASNSRQAGAFSAAAGENAVLSRISINISPAEVVTIELKLFVDNKEVFSTVMKSPKKSGSRDI
jgi:Thin aggregative fimbriae synthesis protein